MLYTTQVEFLGEPGDDFGGPSRELWMLLGNELQSGICEGGVLIHDAVALKV